MNTRSSSKALVTSAVRTVVQDLVARRFEALVTRTSGIRLSAEEIEEGIDECYGTLVEPPESAYEAIDSIEVEGASPKRWSVRFDLRTQEEGLSDVSIELTVIDVGGDSRVELDNIHIA